MAKLSEFGKEIGKRLIDLDKPQLWLIEEVRNKTGLYFDDSYLYKIKMSGPSATFWIYRSIVRTPQNKSDKTDR